MLPGGESQSILYGSLAYRQQAQLCIQGYKDKGPLPCAWINADKGRFHN
jgi:hypothetical protein